MFKGFSLFIATDDSRSVLENSHCGIKILLDDGFSLKTWASKNLEYPRNYEGKWFGSGNGVTVDPSSPPGAVLLESLGGEKAIPEVSKGSGILGVSLVRE